MKNKHKDRPFNTMTFTCNDTSEIANVPSISHMDAVNVTEKKKDVFCSLSTENMIIHHLGEIYSTREHRSVWLG